MNRDKLKDLDVMISLYKDFTRNIAFVAESERKYFDDIHKAYETALQNLIKEIATTT